MAETTVGSAARSGVELRVHGIGDHEIFSALDGPTDREEIAQSHVSVDGPPAVPAHRLRMVNWSRANRKLTVSAVWYLAFPFTLLNVAGYMMPTRTGLDRVFRGGLFVTGLCMTTALAVWMAAIVETAWRWLVDAPKDSVGTLILLSCASPGVLICVVVYRLWRGRANANKADKAFALITIGTLVALALALLARPAMLEYPNSHQPVDVMTIFVHTTSVIAWLVAFGLSGLSVILRRRNPAPQAFSHKHGTPYAGAALLCLFGMTLLHAGGSILRLAVASMADAITPNPVLLGRGDTMLIFRPQEVDLAEPVLLSTPLRIDLLPIFTLEFMAVLAIMLWFMFRVSQLNENVRERFRLKKKSLGYRSIASDGQTRLQPTSKAHDRLSDLPTTLAYTALVTTVLVGALWAGTAGALKHLDPQGPLQFLVLSVKVLGGLLVAAVLLQRPKRLSARFRDLLGRLGDVAGFWSPDIHPLAGTSYRPAVLAGIDIAIHKAANRDNPIVLVGHSQGSIVSAWYVAMLGWADWRDLSDAEFSSRLALPASSDLRDLANDKSFRPALITCGSPLSSLYATFFPRYFSPGFFDRIRSNAADHVWLNFWRQTDPIATPVPKARNINVTETVNEPTLGHSRYFTNACLQIAVRRLLCPHGPHTDRGQAACLSCGADMPVESAPPQRNLNRADHLLDFERRKVTVHNKTKDVLVAGNGPAVIVLPGLPGITPGVARFARWLRDAGFTTYTPDLFGKAGKPRGANGGYTALSIGQICLSRQFHVLRPSLSGPLAVWLRGLAEDAHGECGGRGVGVVGMCVTGKLSLATMLSPSVVGAVMAQPSLPILSRRGSQISPADLDALGVRLRENVDFQVLAYRFDGDRFCKEHSFSALHDALGPQFKGTSIEDRYANPAASGRPHSVLTEHLIDEPGQPTSAARDEIIAHFGRVLCSDHQ